MESHEAPEQGLTVGEVAQRAHVSVRTLHHYDEIGLLQPAARSSAGYRLYDGADLERLHQVLLFRELGLGLEAIAGIVDASAEARRETLLEHRTALEARRRRTDAVIRAVDRAIEVLATEGDMSGTELFEGFESFDHAQYAEEAEERWGDTEAYRESQRRIKSFSPEQWGAVKAEADSIEARMAELLNAGADPTGPEARALAEEHRAHIGRFYACPPRMHAGLADMYESDPRFRSHYDQRADGLAAFVSAAIRANAARREPDAAPDQG